MLLTTQPFRYTAQDLAEAGRAVTGQTMSITTYVGLAGLFGTVVGIGLASFVGTALRDTRFAEAVPAGLSGWFALAATLAGLAFVARKADRAVATVSDDTVPEQRVAFADDGVHLLGLHGTSTTLWSGFTAATWRGDDLLLTTKLGPIVLVPARAMPDAAERASLRALIAERLPG